MISSGEGEAEGEYSKEEAESEGEGEPEGEGRKMCLSSGTTVLPLYRIIVCQVAPTTSTSILRAARPSLTAPTLPIGTGMKITLRSRSGPPALWTTRGPELDFLPTHSWLGRDTNTLYQAEVRANLNCLRVSFSQGRMLSSVT